jgi:hypothetical protein
VVNGRGFHFFVGFSWILVTVAYFAAKHLSYKIVTMARSKSRFRAHAKLTEISSRLCLTLMDQKGSGTKF